jgi:hypothetical protein
MAFKGQEHLLSQSTCAINSIELGEVDFGSAAPADTSQRSAMPATPLS